MQTIYQVDAFTDRAFSGNPAAVCLLDADQPDSWMQSVAMEMNLSETAFLRPEGERWRIRWFTPDMEEELCGHATLASAHILWEQGLLTRDATAAFASRSGPLGARLEADGSIVLDFPAEPASARPLPDWLPGVLGLPPAAVLWVGRNRLDYLLELSDAALVRRLTPDFAALRALAAPEPFRGVIVTSRGDAADYDCVSRFFSTEPSVPEDPVTGSAHCCIGPYWAGRLGKAKLRAYQASARGGVLRLAMKGPRVELGGRAVTVLQGSLLA